MSDGVDAALGATTGLLATAILVNAAGRVINGMPRQRAYGRRRHYEKWQMAKHKSIKHKKSYW